MISLYRPLFLFVLLVFLGVGCADSQQAPSSSAAPAPVDSTVEKTPEGPHSPVNDFEAFWGDFQAAIAAQSGENLARYVVFPLTGAQYLVGKPDDPKGIAQPSFVANTHLVFDEKARETIAGLSADQVEVFDLDRSQYDIEGLKPQGRRVVVLYQEEDYESAIIYHFGETRSGFKLIEIAFAG